MSSVLTEDEIATKLKALAEEIIIPEPQCTTQIKLVFSKYLAEHLESSSSNEALVHITNSHGIQLRNDVNYWMDRKDENSVLKAPVLDPAYLQPFRSYTDIVTKVKELPEEWTVVQVTKEYSSYDIYGDIKEPLDPGIVITRFSCGKLAERVQPYSVIVSSRNQIGENIMQLLKDLVKVRREYFVSNRATRKLKEEYANTDPGLMKFLIEFENQWIKEWKCLLGGRLEDRKLEKETFKQVESALENFRGKSKRKIKCIEASKDMVYQIALASHVMKNKEILKALNYALYRNELDNVNELFLLMEELKRINLMNSCAVKRARKCPVVLIIDNAFELVPWEMMSLLTTQPVTRIISLHLLYALFKYHEPYIVDGYRKIRIDSGYCLINPSKDLVQCEKEINQFLKKNLPWVEIESGKLPDPQSLVSRFQNYNVFFYCGHGSGMQYLKSGDIKSALVKGLVLLFGCSSNMPKNAGGRTPFHNDTYTYLTNGCPSLVGFIYDITSSDADKACIEILSTILPVMVKEDPRKTKFCLENSDILRGVVNGKLACRHYWSQSSLVARGLPCKTEKGAVKVSL